MAVELDWTSDLLIYICGTRKSGRSVQCRKRNPSGDGTIQVWEWESGGDLPGNDTTDLDIDRTAQELFVVGLPTLHEDSEVQNWATLWCLDSTDGSFNWLADVGVRPLCVLVTASYVFVGGWRTKKDAQGDDEYASIWCVDRYNDHEILWSADTGNHVYDVHTAGSYLYAVGEPGTVEVGGSPVSNATVFRILAAAGTFSGAYALSTRLASVYAISDSPNDEGVYVCGDRIITGGAPITYASVWKLSLDLSSETWEYDTNGDAQKLVPSYYDPPDYTIRVGTATETSSEVFKLTKLGAKVWQIHDSYWGLIQGLAVDDEGHCVVVGTRMLGNGILALDGYGHGIDSWYLGGATGIAVNVRRSIGDTPYLYAAGYEIQDRTGSPASTKNLAVGKFDFNGNAQWITDFTTGGGSPYKSGYVVAGFPPLYPVYIASDATDRTGGGSYHNLRKLTSGGAITWEKLIPDEGYASTPPLTAIAMDDDGYIYVGGELVQIGVDEESNPIYSCLYRIDPSTGAIDWSWPSTTSFAFSFSVRSIALGPGTDPDVWIAVESVDEDVFRITQDADPPSTVWQYDRLWTAPVEGSLRLRMVQTESGVDCHVLLSGGKYPDGALTRQGWVVRLDENGAGLWYWPDDLNDAPTLPAGLGMSDAGDVMACGRYDKIWRAWHSTAICVGMKAELLHPIWNSGKSIDLTMVTDRPGHDPSLGIRTRRLIENVA